MNPTEKTSWILTGIAMVFGMLVVAFVFEVWGRPLPLPDIPLAASEFTNTATARISYAELIRTKADLSDFDCYGCHEKGQPPLLRFDANQILIIPKEHADVVMGHGSHNRNNNCFNCHNETNLDLLQTRDGRQLKLVESSPLCGSCHGPTYRDWEAGAHGRISGYWDRLLGPMTRQNCVACHNPHSPAFPGRPPAPGPHPLHTGRQKLAVNTSPP